MIKVKHSKKAKIKVRCRRRTVRTYLLAGLCAVTLSGLFSVTAHGAEEQQEQFIQNNSAVQVLNDSYEAHKTFEEQQIAEQERQEEERQKQLEQEHQQELLDRYSFALYDTSGNRNDITPELLEYIEETCNENGIEPELMLSIVMTESEGHANAHSKKSTATGLCQLLKRTAKHCYNDLLGYDDTYIHDMSYNPELNVQMAVAYMSELKDENNGSMYKALQGYRGKKNISSYLSTMDKWLKKSGKSVYQYI